VIWIPLSSPLPPLEGKVSPQGGGTFPIPNIIVAPVNDNPENGSCQKKTNTTKKELFNLQKNGDSLVLQISK
jgi:hypothetical protein